MQVWTLQVSQALLWRCPSPLKITGTHLSMEVTETRGAGEHIAQCFLLSHFWLESYWALPSSGLPLLFLGRLTGGSQSYTPPCLPHSCPWEEVRCPKNATCQTGTWLCMCCREGPATGHFHRWKQSPQQLLGLLRNTQGFFTVASLLVKSADSHLPSKQSLAHFSIFFSNWHIRTPSKAGSSA